MGGQNHQPTNKVLTSASAFLSRAVSDGFALVLQSNSHLEDAIMLGMDQLYVKDLTPGLKGSAKHHLSLAIEKLEASKSTLGDIDIGFQRLFHAAKCERYGGNPLVGNLTKYDLFNLFECNLIQPAGNEKVWRELESRIQKSNVLVTLEWEQQQFSLLRAPTEKLIETLRFGQTIVGETSGRSFVDALEDNAIPLRQYYAQVFSLWNYLQCMFLYSALIMTELYYRANGLPSLLDFKPLETQSHVA